ncbi:MAG TPA: ester cyclase [Anaerolineae bacterium]|nr:ester cyclase [Anaerolineae bacterium]
MNADDNAAVARRLYEAFNRQDFDRCLALAREDIEVVLTPFDQTFHGHAGFKKFMAIFKTAFPDLTVTVTHQITTADQVVSECHWRGTHTGPLVSPAGEIPATGKTVVKAVFCEVWGLKNGKVANLRNYQDVSSWLRQLGLVP